MGEENQVQENIVEQQADAAPAEQQPKRRGRPPADPNAPKLSHREKLMKKFEEKKALYTKLATDLQELAAEIQAIDAAASIEVGTTVYINVGKGETRKEVEAKVIGIREDEETGKQYKVAYGSGFDADVKVVGASRLRLTPTPASEVAQEAAAETQTAE